MKDGKYTLLYVDDEELNLRVFKYSFRKEFNVVLALSAKRGLEYLSKHKVDAIITDHYMPDVTGVEFLKKVHELYGKDSPVKLIVSGYAETSEIQKAYDEYGLSDFIAKPWDIVDLKQKILAAIETKNKSNEK